MLFRLDDTVHNRRIAAKFIQDKKILNKLFTELGPRMKDRKGGYTRILKIGFRQGDAADMVILELVDYKLPTEESKEKPAKAKKVESKAESSDKPAKKPAAKKTTAKASASKTKAEKAEKVAEEAK